ncbi:MAG: isochorismatase family protein [Pigmentiphaga sp.]|uniref:isochorismatase family protein n=1 Tax=Pigmentiphaga sp. TaxID=1977564 RepID=UPI0029AD2526|nr:isochorismatase family protein [Pigmentiphaga sp.]MDX3905141.1 isochorismatase family protein [Pigmentiphaga sp.]
MTDARLATEAPPWASIIPPHELALYAHAGFGNSSAPPKRPALLVVDVQYRSVGRVRAPIEESIKQYPTSCGEFGWRAIPHIARLIQAFRAKGLPVIYPHVAPKKAHDGQRFAEKVPAIMGIPLDGYEFVEECAPQEGDILLPKHHASAFFGTPLASYLTTLRVDGLVMAGTTTSGCIRASVIDGSSFGYPIMVPYDAVFDRSQTSHAVNLFDMNSKYADVMKTDDVLALI